MEDGAELDGYAILFRREYPSNLRMSYAIIGDRQAAQEVCQEAFARLYANWAKVGGYERPGAWVRRVAIRLAVRQRSRPSTTALDDRAASATLEPSERVDLVRALGELPSAQRAAIVLHYLLDLPFAAVAAELGCREATARVHVHRARHRLAELLREEVHSGDR